MRLLSLFSGGGGLDMAAELLWPDLQHVAFSELDPHAATVYERWRPGVPNLGDVTTIDWNELRGTLMGDRRRRDEKAQAMYARYRQGLSLAQVAAEFGVTRQSVYGLFQGRGWELRPRPQALEAVEFNGRRYTLRNTGYYGATTGARTLLHRDVWEHHHGTIPDGYDIHHRDHDKTNNALANLECLPKDEHARRYGTGCNQFVHGCGGGDATEEPAVDVLTAGFP
jgi:hypothetical protein